MVDDGRMTDGRRPDHGHPISSPCEPDGSGELKNPVPKSQTKPFHIGTKEAPSDFCARALHRDVLSGGPSLRKHAHVIQIFFRCKN